MHERDDPLSRLLLLASVLSIVLLFEVEVRATDITFSSSATIPAGDLTYDGCEVIVTGVGTVLTIDGDHDFASFQILSGATVTHTAGTGSIDLAIAGDLFIDGGSRIDVSGRGSPSGMGCEPGDGAGPGSGAGGGGYGGRGGNGDEVGGGSYGSFLEPSDLGSGGGASVAPGGAGGGRIRLVVVGEFELDGVLLANGGDVASPDLGGGGSGGSVFVCAGVLSGSGAIHANGGIGGRFLTERGGGGGGGRVAVSFGTNDSTVGLTAYGGQGAQIGGAGTVLFGPVSGPLPELIIDNDSHPGASTELEPGVTPVPANVRVRRCAVLSPPFGEASHLVVAGDLRVAADAAISANGLGNGPRSGPGAGEDGTPPESAGGGGYGGAGGDGSGTAEGGDPYGSAETPTDPGSGGGSSAGRGGFGGGAIRLTVGGELSLDGAIRANGTDGLNHPNGSGGGGSGGGILLDVGSLSPSPVILARGGNGAVDGGGGGGGRIAIHTCDPSVDLANVEVFGGAGGNPGAAGTVHVENIASPCPGLVTTGLVLTATPSDLVTQAPVSRPDGSVTVQPAVPEAFKVRGHVVVRDSVGQRIPGAWVVAHLIGPRGGRVLRFMEPSDARGFARFSGATVTVEAGAPTTLRLTIESVVLPGVLFDRDASETVVELVVP